MAGSDPAVDCGKMGPGAGHVCVRCAAQFAVGLSGPGDVLVDVGANVGAAAVLLITGVAARMGEGDPAWLEQSLGVRAGPVTAARAAVALLYAQGVILQLQPGGARQA